MEVFCFACLFSISIFKQVNHLCELDRAPGDTEILPQGIVFNCLIKKIEGNGACLYQCTQTFMTGRRESYINLRKRLQNKLIINWKEDYEPSLPLIEESLTVQIGAQGTGYSKIITNTNQLFDFLQSSESLKSYHDFQNFDIQNISNYFNIGVAIFSYSYTHGVLEASGWKYVLPNEKRTGKSFYNYSYNWMYLLNESDTHFNLMVARDHANKAYLQENLDDILEDESMPETIIQEQNKGNENELINVVEDHESNVNEEIDRED